MNAPELRSGLIQLLENHEESASATRYTELRFVVLEAVLHHIHKELGARVTVGEIAQTAMAILKGRGDSSTHGPREVGEKLRDLGLVAKRRSDGYAITLDEAASRKVHQLADIAGLLRMRKLDGKCYICVEALNDAPRSRS